MQETQEMWVQSLGWEDTLEEEMATHSSIAWKIPRTEEPGGLQSMGRKESDMTEQLAMKLKDAYSLEEKSSPVPFRFPVFRVLPVLSGLFLLYLSTGYPHPPSHPPMHLLPFPSTTTGISLTLPLIRFPSLPSIPRGHVYALFPGLY